MPLRSLPQRRHLWWGSITAVETFRFVCPHFHRAVWDRLQGDVNTCTACITHDSTPGDRQAVTGKGDTTLQRTRPFASPPMYFRLFLKYHHHYHLSRPVPSPSTHLHNILTGLGLWNVTDEPATSNPSQWAVTKQQGSLVTRRLMLGVCPIVLPCLLSLSVLHRWQQDNYRRWHLLCCYVGLHKSTPLDNAAGWLGSECCYSSILGNDYDLPLPKPDFV